MHVSVSAFPLLNCEWLIKTVIVYLAVTRYMDNCGNSRANTCVKTRLLGRVVFIRYKANHLRVLWMIHDKRTKRME